MFPKKMDFDSINVLDTGSHKTFPIHSKYGGKILRHTYTARNKINRFHSDLQKYVSYIGSHKFF